MHHLKVGVLGEVGASDISISTRLVGKSLSFSDGSHKVHIVVPNHSEISRTWDEPQDKVASIARQRRVGSKDGDDKFRTIAYHIYKFYIFVEADKKDRHLFFDDGELRARSSFNDFLYASGGGSARLQVVGNELCDVGSRAAQRWINAVRWKAQLPYAAISTIDYFRGRGSYHYRFASLAPRREFNYWYPDPLRMSASKYLFPRDWVSVEAALQEKKLAPIWLNYYFEALHRFEAGDFIGAVLCCAISAESLIRNRLEGEYRRPSSSDKGVLALLQGAKVSDLIDNMDKFTTLSQLNISGNEKMEVKRIFQIRNELMHGRRHTVSRVEANNALAQIELLVGRFQ